MSGEWKAVAIDYDGTLTVTARPGGEVLEALRETRAAGKAVVLVTGRILAELHEDFPEVEDEFDAIVAENGAVLADGDGIRDLAMPVDPALADALTHRDVLVRQGRVLLAGRADDATVALEEIGRLGLDCQLVRNRGELMMLPAGVSKGSGLVEALGNLGISRHSTIAVGDAQNDLSLLEVCEVGVAVGNAVTSLRERADVVLDTADGEGVVELLRGPILTGASRVLPRDWELDLGVAADGNPVRIPASQINVLVTGGSGSGKSYLTGLLAEQLNRSGYSLLLLDREGDHVDLAARRGILALGGFEGVPAPPHLDALLGHRFGSIVLDLSLLDHVAQHDYLRTVAPFVISHRATTGLPHWIFLDEAHTACGDPVLHDEVGDGGATGYCYSTYRPDDLPESVRDHFDFVVVTAGGSYGARESLGFAARLAGLDCETVEAQLGASHGDALLITVDGTRPPVRFAVATRSTGHVRHWHKYVNGQLPQQLRFYFADTGAIAPNIREFQRQIATCPDGTLDSHVAHHDFSRWIGDVLQDHRLAASIRDIEERRRQEDLDTDAVRDEVRAVIAARYLE